MTKSTNVLMVYIEPTPYLMGLIDRVKQRNDGETDVVFLASDLSQDWGLQLQDRQGIEFLPQGATAARGRLKELIASGRYDAVHLAGWGHPLLRAAMLIARRYRVPSLVESDTPRPPDASWIKSAIKKMTYPWLFRLPAMFLPGGTRQAQYIREYSVSDDRITIAQMTVDTAAISRHADQVDDGQRDRIRQRLGLDPGAVVFLYVGRMEAHKGIRVALQAFEKLQSVHSGVNLLLVGEGTIRQEIESKTESNSQIVVAGRLSGTELLDSYAASDVFVLPSLFEPWGLVVNEALASGLGVIATDRVGCVDDLVEPDQTGLVVDADDVDMLSQAMQKLAGDRDLRRRMSVAGRERMKGWSLETEAEIVVDAWKAVVCN